MSISTGTQKMVNQLTCAGCDKPIEAGTSATFVDLSKAANARSGKIYFHRVCARDLGGDLAVELTRV